MVSPLMGINLKMKGCEILSGIFEILYENRLNEYSKINRTAGWHFKGA